MRAKEFIKKTKVLHEFGAATAAPAINLSPEQIKTIPKIGTSDSFPIFGAKFGGQTLISYIADDKLMASVIFDDEFNLRGIKNDSKIKGMISVLMAYVLSELTTSLTISKTELLTLDGLKWVCSNIQNSKLFQITYSDETNPSVNDLEEAWLKANENFSTNDIELIIKMKHTLNESFFEDEFRILPIYRIAYGEIA